jgi:hypothetical protein
MPKNLSAGKRAGLADIRCGKTGAATGVDALSGAPAFQAPGLGESTRDRHTAPCTA